MPDKRRSLFDDPRWESTSVARSAPVAAPSRFFSRDGLLAIALTVALGAGVVWVLRNRQIESDRNLAVLRCFSIDMEARQQLFQTQMAFIEAGGRQTSIDRLRDDLRERDWRASHEQCVKRAKGLE
jgi:hypothetical protein